MLTANIGFIGAGQMAQALAHGFVAAGRVPASQILAADPSPAARQAFQAAVPEATVTNDNALVVAQAEIVVLAVKPQYLASVLEPFSAAETAGRLFISIAAGATLGTLIKGLQTDRVVRVMPNTPCLVGQAAAGYCLGPGALPEDGPLVEQLLSAVGLSFALEERLLDAVTGLSGSGPAYVYVMIEALSDGGVKMGLPRDVATKLAAQTVRGAAEMVLSDGRHPAALKDAVASPGGTTIAGLAMLEERGVRAGLIAAVEAATRRSIELGKPSSP